MNSLIYFKKLLKIQSEIFFPIITRLKPTISIIQKHIKVLNT